MGKLITIAGNLGAGKTTLTRLICNQAGFTPYWETPERRTFQQAFSEDLSRWALANQMDFLLFRCQQELQVRKSDQVAVMDGGLDQDFHVFTKNLRNKGHLGKDEFHLCESYYRFARSFLPPPDVIIRIVIDTPALLKRREGRVRKTVDQSFNSREFEDLELLLDEWLKGEVASPVLLFPFEQDLSRVNEEIEALIRQVSVAISNE